MSRQTGANGTVESLTTNPCCYAVPASLVFCLWEGTVNYIFHILVGIFPSETLTSDIPNSILVELVWWSPVFLGMHLLECLLFRYLSCKHLAQTLASWKYFIPFRFLSHQTAYVSLRNLAVSRWVLPQTCQLLIQLMMKTAPPEEGRAPIFQWGIPGLNSDWSWAPELPVAWASSKAISCSWDRKVHVPFGEVISSFVFLSTSSGKWTVGSIISLHEEKQITYPSFDWCMIKPLKSHRSANLLITGKIYPKIPEHYLLIGVHFLN